MKTPGWILTILLSILMAAVLELNQNTLFGWFLFALAFVGMIEEPDLVLYEILDKMYGWIREDK